MESRLQKLLRALFTCGLRQLEENCSLLENNASFSLTFLDFSGMRETCEVAVKMSRQLVTLVLFNLLVALLRLKGNNNF